MGCERRSSKIVVGVVKLSHDDTFLLRLAEQQLDDIVGDLRALTIVYIVRERVVGEIVEVDGLLLGWILVEERVAGFHVIDGALA